MMGEIIRECSADFTINGQSGNYKVAAGVSVTLQAEDAEATTYQWEVSSSPPDRDYELTDADQAQATLLLPQPGAYVVRLLVTKGACEDYGRAIVWAETPQRQYRLPATAEPLRFNGNAAWAGDLVQVIQDVDANLPTQKQKEALAAANNPGAENPFVTRQELPKPQLVTRAAGWLDLSVDDATAPTVGNLRIVEKHERYGRVKLSFAGYDEAKKQQYVIFTQTVHEHPMGEVDHIFLAEVAEYADDGFVLHMHQITRDSHSGQAALAPQCMVEVKEIVLE